MRTRILFTALVVLVPLVAFGRFIQIIEPTKLIAEAKLVFVGQVQSVKPSGIATHLSYPTWDGVSFPWLSVRMKVLAPVKGVRKGDVVQVMMLSIADNGKQPWYCPPEVLEPDQGDIFFACLGPTPITNAFAALTGPYDENLSVLPLHRSHETNTDSTEADYLLSNDKRFALIGSLVTPAGELLPDRVAKLRRRYVREISITPTNDLVYLEWEAYTNEHGWSTDVPKGFSPTNSGAKK